MNNYDLIVSQGRIADRTDSVITGALLTANALEAHITGKRIDVGTPEAAVNDSWQDSLPQAEKTLNGLKSAIEQTLNQGQTPFMVANTCSASLATLPLAVKSYPDCFVLWFDAHGDFNTPATTDSGYLGGMVLAAACGLWDSKHGNGVSGRQVVIIGARDIDEEEAKLLNKAGVTIITPEQATPETVLKIIGNASVWIHVDWDVLEPGFIPADYKVANGLLPNTIKNIFSAIPKTQIKGVEIAEFEATGKHEQDSQSVSIIIDTVSPLLDL